MTETLSEIVEREAAAAEADSPELPEGIGPGGEILTAPDTESGEPVEPPSSITESAEREKKLRSEDTRHENALKKIYGEEFVDHAFCPLCIGQGFLVPIPPGNQPDEVWEAVMALSGRMPAAQFNHPETLVTCERCDGWGQVASGAKSEHHAIIPCALCDSRGYFNLEDPIHKGKLGLNPAQQPVNAPVFPIYHQQEPATVNGAVEQPPAGWHASGSPGADQWSRWPGHPRYGIDPANNGGVW